MQNYLLLLIDDMYELDKANYYVEKCIKMNGNDKYSYHTFGNYYGYIFNKQKCIKMFDKMLFIDSNYTQGLFNYSCELYKFGMYSKLLEYLQKCLKLNDNRNGLVYFLLGIVYNELGTQ